MAKLVMKYTSNGRKTPLTVEIALRSVVGVVLGVAALLSITWFRFFPDVSVCGDADMFGVCVVRIFFWLWLAVGFLCRILQGTDCRFPPLHRAALFCVVAFCASPFLFAMPVRAQTALPEWTATQYFVLAVWFVGWVFADLLEAFSSGAPRVGEKVS